MSHSSEIKRKISVLLEVTIKPLYVELCTKNPNYSRKKKKKKLQISQTVCKKVKLQETEYL